LVIFQNQGIYSLTAEETWIYIGSNNSGLATDNSFLCYEQWPSSSTSGDLPLLRAAAFLGNVLEAARWFKPVALSTPSRHTLAAADLQ
jgi:hypothetical protein